MSELDGDDMNIHKTDWSRTLRYLSLNSFPLYLFSKSSQIPCVVSRTFGLKIYIFIHALKEEKSGHTMIHKRAMKGNGFYTGLTSQINLHRCFSKNQQNAKQSLTPTQY